MSEHIVNSFAAEAPAGSSRSVATLPRTALLYADEGLLAHVEQALAALGVPVVYRAAIAQDHSALAGAHPQIALINLDDRCGEELDPLTAMLDAAGVPIVFNDADISKGLEGWARSRWARHLCAKLCGNGDVDPPRPSHDAVPQAASDLVVETPAETVRHAEVEPVPVSEPDESIAEPASASRPLSQGEIDSLVADFPSEAAVGGADTEALSAHIDALLADAPAAASHEPAPWEVIGFAEAEPAQSAPASAPAIMAVASSAAPVSSQPVIPPSADQWKLVEDFTPTAPAAKPTAPAPTTSFGSGLSLELEPLDPTEGSR